MFGALMRMIPHWPNFTPVAALALFGGALYGRKWLAFIIPLGAMFLSDLVLGLHQGIIAVYLAFALVVLLGFGLGQKPGALKLGAFTLIASLIFFIITNFAVWLGGIMYPLTFAGLMACYTAALPFFLNSVLGNIFFVSLFFGAWYLLTLRFPALQEKRV
ncbi:MAG: hypothetical protein Kow00127_22420 [Bacteroidales bacterium]